MKRTSTRGLLSDAKLTEYKQRIIYHEAGHAAAIHFNGRVNNLPSLSYSIMLNDWHVMTALTKASATLDDKEYIASVSGGRFMQALPAVLHPGVALAAQQLFDGAAQLPLSFETDIVNLLVGSMAEAKYIALLDGEPFAKELLSVQALQEFYGGEADMQSVYECLQKLDLDAQQQQQLLQQFFEQAFNFVNSSMHWKAIVRLAEYILGNPKPEIDYSEATGLLESPKRH